MSEKIWKILAIVGILTIGWMALKLLSSFPPQPQRGVYDIRSPFGFGGSKKALEKSSFPENIPYPSEGKESLNRGEEEISRMVVKNGWLNLVVKDIKETAKKISQFAIENGGYVVESNIYEKETLPSGYITVRVPAEKFEIAIESFKKMAVRVSNEGTRAQDVTEEYVDLEARLRNLEAAEKQLLEIMTRAGKMSEVLEVQRELTNVRNQIEKIKGRMEYLEREVKMSSITVNLALSEELLPVPPAEKWRPKYVFLQSWKSVLHFWKEFSYFIIRLIVWAQLWLPILIIILLLRKSLKRKKAANV